MYTPAGYGIGGNNGQQLSWDTWLYPYSGGSASMTQEKASFGVYAVDGVVAQSLDIGVGLPVFACPTDVQLPKIDWMHYNTDPGEPLRFAVKTYEMVSAGKAWSTDFQVDPLRGKYPLPNLMQPNRYGVGIYWQAPSGTPDYGAKGYPASVVKDPSGTILLCELSASQNPMGNIWPCVCKGPWTSAGEHAALFQIDDAAPVNNPAKLLAENFSTGTLLYKAQGSRFNYACHDGHVETLKWTDTLGNAGPMIIARAYPAGMWTVKAGD